ncbi:hypothetical protein PHMEG_0005857 [Phytophthora megakarya]|uniref:Reverse transcriptase RNase H-like domain-containing protein n=1 Tax=Phytophthora megakarya TaxID=4795 RepID=A0A225WS90_9STRA|nr:hypothetical protein PHMEG_0005857 [Phytophthora megakarya]
MKPFKQARFENVMLHTSTGAIVLRNLECWIDESDETQALTVGHSVMVALGYSTDGQLVTSLESYDARHHHDNENDANISEKLEVALEDAKNRGLHGHALAMLEPSLKMHEAEFCVAFGSHPPVKVEPMRVKIPPDTTPVRFSARRYAPMQQAFMDAHIAELEELKLVYRNYTSRLAFVITLTIPMQWPMPQLAVVITHVVEAKVFFICEWFRGYWQLSLNPDSRGVFTFITHRGMYTPTRAPMGAKDDVAYCQSVVELIFGVLLYNVVLSEQELMELLEEVLQRCEKFGLKLHPGKCKFFLKEVIWCGKVISENGVTHNPDRVQGLVDMLTPSKPGRITTVHMCFQLDAVKYFRSCTSHVSVSCNFKELTRKNDCKNVGWGDEEVQSLAQVKAKLLTMVPLVHSKDNWEVTMVMDASLDHWGGCYDAKALSEQQNQPLAFLSSPCRGASHRRSIIEKEAFAIVESCKRLEYRLLRPRGVRFYTDDRNLVYIFNPYAIDGSMQRYQADKLQRWSMSLLRFNYTIEHIQGDDNS